MTALTIRPLTAADRAGWDPLWQGYLTFYKASIASDISDVTFARLTGGEPGHLLPAGPLHRAQSARQRRGARADRGGAADSAGQGLLSRLLADA